MHISVELMDFCGICFLCNVYWLLTVFQECNAKYRRYFYDPFSDWDNEYYDANLDDLQLGTNILVFKTYNLENFIRKLH